MRNESVERLEEAGLLDVSTKGEEGSDPSATSTDITRVQNIVARPDIGEIRGVPWFEEMVQGSDMGRVRRRRGGETSADGKSRVEWEVVEIGGDDGEGVASSTTKRKISSVTGEGDGADVPMRG